MKPVRHISMLFQGAMIRALLNGTKGQTRRLSFKGEAGDLIYCREAWRVRPHLDHLKPLLLSTSLDHRLVCYEAGGDMEIEFDRDGRPYIFQQSDCSVNLGGRLRASMHLPKWGSRLTLRISEVRLEPLQDISEADALAEGVSGLDMPAHGADERTGRPPLGLCPSQRYAKLWESINGAESWAANPMVHVITFEVLRENIFSVVAQDPEESI